MREKLNDPRFASLACNNLFFLIYNSYKLIKSSIQVDKYPVLVKINQQSKRTTSSKLF